MTPLDLKARLVGRVDEEIKKVTDWLEVDAGYTAQFATDDANRHLGFLRALRVAIEMCSRNGYTTWDKSMVPLIDGKYEEEAAKKWELEHGHDIRLKCYPEFGCQLLIDSENLILAIGSELGVTL